MFFFRRSVCFFVLLIVYLFVLLLSLVFLYILYYISLAKDKAIEISFQGWIQPCEKPIVERPVRLHAQYHPCTDWTSIHAITFAGRRELCANTRTLPGNGKFTCYCRYLSLKHLIISLLVQSFNQWNKEYCVCQSIELTNF